MVGSRSAQVVVPPRPARGFGVRRERNQPRPRAPRRDPSTRMPAPLPHPHPCQLPKHSSRPRSPGARPRHARSRHPHVRVPGRRRMVLVRAASRGWIGWPTVPYARAAGGWQQQHNTQWPRVRGVPVPAHPCLPGDRARLGTPSVPLDRAPRWRGAGYLCGAARRARLREIKALCARPCWW